MANFLSHQSAAARERYGLVSTITAPPSLPPHRSTQLAKVTHAAALAPNASKEPRKYQLIRVRVIA
jgi:hypothetical protein